MKYDKNEDHSKIGKKFMNQPRKKIYNSIFNFFLFLKNVLYFSCSQATYDTGKILLQKLLLLYSTL